MQTGALGYCSSSPHSQENLLGPARAGAEAPRPEKTAQRDKPDMGLGRHIGSVDIGSSHIRRSGYASSVPHRGSQRRKTQRSQTPDPTSPKKVCRSVGVLDSIRPPPLCGESILDVAGMCWLNLAQCVRAGYYLVCAGWIYSQCRDCAGGGGGSRILRGGGEASEGPSPVSPFPCPYSPIQHYFHLSTAPGARRSLPNGTATGG